MSSAESPGSKFYGLVWSLGGTFLFEAELCLYKLICTCIGQESPRSTWKPFKSSNRSGIPLVTGPCLQMLRGSNSCFHLLQDCGLMAANGCFLRGSELVRWYIQVMGDDDDDDDDDDDVLTLFAQAVLQLYLRTCNTKLLVPMVTWWHLSLLSGVHQISQQHFESPALHLSQICSLLSLCSNGSMFATGLWQDWKDRLFRNVRTLQKCQLQIWWQRLDSWSVQGHFPALESAEPAWTQVHPPENSWPYQGLLTPQKDIPGNPVNCKKSWWNPGEKKRRITGGPLQEIHRLVSSSATRKPWVGGWQAHQSQ